MNLLSMGFDESGRNSALMSVEAPIAGSMLPASNTMTQAKRLVFPDIFLKFIAFHSSLRQYRIEDQIDAAKIAAGFVDSMGRISSNTRLPGAASLRETTSLLCSSLKAVPLKSTCKPMSWAANPLDK